MSNLDFYPAGNRALSELAENTGLSLRQQIDFAEKRMKDAAKRLEFEEAAVMRDKLRELKQLQIYTD
jgi:excinuclease ABC subunit B